MEMIISPMRSRCDVCVIGGMAGVKTSCAGEIFCKIRKKFSKEGADLAK